MVGHQRTVTGDVSKAVSEFLVRRVFIVCYSPSMDIRGSRLIWVLMHPKYALLKGAMKAAGARYDTAEGQTSVVRHLTIHATGAYVLVDGHVRHVDRGRITGTQTPVRLARRQDPEFPSTPVS